jgi:aromatic-L-amino-acid/L-tryptophan decarboxylase
MESSARGHDAQLTGDMDPLSFRQAGHALVDWVARYLEDGDRYPVLSTVAPGDIRSRLPESAPETGRSMDEIFSDFERVLLPGLTRP